MNVAKLIFLSFSCCCRTLARLVAGARAFHLRLIAVIYVCVYAILVSCTHTEREKTKNSTYNFWSQLFVMICVFAILLQPFIYKYIFCVCRFFIIAQLGRQAGVHTHNKSSLLKSIKLVKQQQLPLPPLPPLSSGQFWDSLFVFFSPGRGDAFVHVYVIHFESRILEKFVPRLSVLPKHTSYTTTVAATDTSVKI